MKLLAISSIAWTLFWCGCQTMPADYLRDPRPDGATGIWAGQWLIYGDELETGGGLLLFPSDENQTIDLVFRHPNDPERGNVIHYSWNGEEVAGQYTFSGVSFTVASNWRAYDITPPKDLSAGGYTKISFDVWGDLSEGTKVEFWGGRRSATTGRLKLDNDDGWVHLDIPLRENDLKKVREFFVIVFQFAEPSGHSEPGQGGTVYVDNIRYEK